MKLIEFAPTTLRDVLFDCGEIIARTSELDIAQHLVSSIGSKQHTKKLRKKILNPRVLLEVKLLTV